MRMVKVLAYIGCSAFVASLWASDEEPSTRWWAPLQVGIWGEEAQLFSKDREVRGLRLSLPYSECEVACGVAFGVVSHVESSIFSGELGAVNVIDDGRALQVGLMNSANLEIIVLPFLGQGPADAAACQLGLINLASDWGLQVGALNFSSGSGLQLGAVNFGGFDGVQAGLFYNDACEARGLQIGLVNVARSLAGVQVGIVNIIKDGPVPLMPLVNAHF